MQIKELNQIPNLDQNKRLRNRFLLWEKYIGELRNKELTAEFIEVLNTKIDEINSCNGPQKQQAKLLRKSLYGSINKLEKELKIVPKNHYRNRWMAIGMSAFGVGIGVAFGAALKNMAFLAIGIPIGMSIGLAIGAGMDKKAFDEGRQLDMEISI